MPRGFKLHFSQNWTEDNDVIVVVWGRANSAGNSDNLPERNVASRLP